MRTFGLSLAVVILAGTGTAAAQPELEGATLAVKLKPQIGFVDDPFAFDGGGGRLLWINADADKRAELRIVDLAQAGAQLAAIDISKFTTSPIRADFVLDGNRYFVVARDSDDAALTAALIDGAGKVVRRFGPATDIRLRQSARAEVVTYNRVQQNPKKGTPTIQHNIAIYDLASGRRKVQRQLVAAESGMVAKLDFRIVAFASEYTRVMGIKGGVWDKKEDQRTPDVEAWYDLAAGKFISKVDITDVIAHAKKQKLLADHPNQDPFLMVAEDLSGLHLVEGGVARRVELAEVFHHYDHKSLQVQSAAPGATIYFTMTIDPVHPDAVARKRAVTQYIDLYELKAGERKATRRSRLKRPGNFLFRATGEHWAVLPLHLGFSRGGTEMRVYALK